MLNNKLGAKVLFLREVHDELIICSKCYPHLPSAIGILVIKLTTRKPEDIYLAGVTSAIISKVSNYFV